MGKVTFVAAAISCWLAGAARGADLVVTNASDLVNGDTSSITALLSNPGPDGVSLREAVAAVNNTPGVHTITFSPALAGAVIALQGHGLDLTRDNVTLAGLVGNGGEPLVTLTPVTPTDFQPMLSVYASVFTMTGLKLTGMQQGGGVAVLAGRPGDKGAQLTGIRIERNIFDNEGVSTPNGFFVTIGPRLSIGASISDIHVVHNRFAHLPTDSMLGIGTDSSVNSLVADVVVEDNEFIDGLYGFECGAGGSGNRTSGVRVERNTFTRIGRAIPLLCGGGSGNLVENVLISANVFTDDDSDVGVNGGVDCANCSVRNVRIVGNEMASRRAVHNIEIRGGQGGESPTRDSVVENVTIEENRIASPVRPIWIVAGLDGGSGNRVRNTTIRNNVLVASPAEAATIVIHGGTGQATGNQVEGVSIVNNTLVSREGYGIWLESNGDVASGNSVAGVTVLNTIIDAHAGDFRGEVAGNQVSYCLLTGSELGSANHNLTGDPRFVDPGQGDFHLQADSPAIAKGTIEGAPCVDLDGFPRPGDGAVDIGAYEFHGAAIRRASSLTNTHRSRCTTVVPPRSPIP